MESWRGSQAVSGSRCVVSVVLVLIAGCSGGDSNPSPSSTSPNAPPTATFANGVLEAYVKASNTTTPQFRSFGQSVALDGNTLVVGAVDPSCATGVSGNQTNSGCPGAGAVYVFTRTGDTWSQQAYLKASNTQANDLFGLLVSISGDTIAVAAPTEDSCGQGVNGNQADNGCESAGAVYVFTRSGTMWSQQAYVKASDTHAGDGFGSGIVLAGDTLAATGSENGASVVYVFTRTNGTWSQQAVVKPSNATITDGFGSSLALDGDTLAVGAERDQGCIGGVNVDRGSNNCNGAGAVYVFTRTTGVWSQQAYVKASNITLEDLFGSGLALKGDTLAAGARNEDSCANGINGSQSDNGCSATGAVYVFKRSDNVWTQEAYVKAIHTGIEGFGAFGEEVALDGNTLAVSALDQNCARGFNPSPGSNDCIASGVVYLFTRTGTSWMQSAHVKASNTDARDFFGGGGGGPLGGIAISGNTLAVGAAAEDSCATGINGDQNDNRCTYFPPGFEEDLGGAGAVYVYVLE